MKILLVAATELEIADSISSIQEFDTDYLVTGVGMVATAYAMGKHLANNKYDLLVNVGIAGTFNPADEMGTVKRIVSDRIFDLGAETRDGFMPIEELGFGKSIFQERLPGISLGQSFESLKKSTAITVNRVHGRNSSIEQLRKTLPLDCLESMEGAAFFYVAEEQNCPAIQVRSISNLVEQRNVSHWDIPKALQELNSWLQGFLRLHRK